MFLVVEEVLVVVQVVLEEMVEVLAFKEPVELVPVVVQVDEEY